jgi:hypothetical protein
MYKILFIPGAEAEDLLNPQQRWPTESQTFDPSHCFFLLSGIR